MITIRHERPGDAAAREALLDLAYGACRFAKTSERLRAGRRPADGLSLVAMETGRLVGTVRLWPVAIGQRPMLLLGPLAVDPARRELGIGGMLMQGALTEAATRGHAAVLLVGDPPYYARFGFSAEKTGRLWMPGPFARDRLLACELKPGALDGARGMVAATGLPADPVLRPAALPRTDLAA